MIDFEEYELTPGIVGHTLPGQVQRFEENDGLSALLVLFQPEVSGVAARRSSPITVRLERDEAATLQKLVRLMFDLKSAHLSASPDRLAWRLLAAVLEIWESAADREDRRRGSVRSELFRSFDALLDENFTEQRNVSWYAGELGTTEKTLSRWCQRVAGIGAKAVIDRKVALEAKRRLVHTEDAVHTIAHQLGFSEPTNFTKFFRRLEGEPPEAFRFRYSD